MDKTDTPVDGAVAPVTDTATTQTNEASELSQSTPEDTQTNDQQETVQTEVKTEDTVQEEKLFAGKYKTVEDLEKSYKELESSFGKKTNEYAELTKILNEAFIPPEPAAEDTAYDDPGESAAATDPLKRKVTLLEFALTHSDADGEAMKKVLAEDPLVSKINGDDAKLEYAYYRAKSLTMETNVAEAQRQAQVQTHAKIAEKELAKVESVTKTEPADDSKANMTKATGGTPEERKSARLALIRQHLTKL